MRLRDAARLARQRFAQEAREKLYLSLGVDTTRPLAVQGIVNERCNYKCAYCEFWRLAHYKDEMGLEDWQRALAGLQDWIGNFTIQYAGGEPLIYKPFLPLVEFCHARGIGWGVITNGSVLTESVVERLVGAAPINIDISVDGVDAATHDDVRGVKDSLAKIAAGIGRLRAARDRAGSKTSIRIKPTVHRRNLHGLPALVRWTQDVGGDTIDFSPVRPWTPEVDGDLWIRSPEDVATMQRVVDELVALRAAGAPIETEPSRLQSWAAHFRGEAVRPEVSPCRVGLRDFHILPDGEVRMCWHYQTIGSVREHTPKELWHGEVAKRQRAAMMRCAMFGSVECASSCLAHRTLRQDFRRGWMLVRSRLRGG
ncbi:MAG: radical SAM protein [Planctomycetota bacterium]